MDSRRRIRLNVGGTLFVTTADTLTCFPDTRLGRLAGSDVGPPEAELFFDRNPDLMNSLLDFYRTGELHLPRHLCSSTIDRELRFWEVPAEMIQECCYRRVDEHKDDASITQEVDRFLSMPYETGAEIQSLTDWQRIWLVMERPQLNRASKIWNTLYFTLVVLSVLFYCFETTMAFRDLEPWVAVYAAFYNVSVDQFMSVQNLKAKYGASSAQPWLRHSQEAIFGFFVVEFVVRFLTCPRKKYFVTQVKNWLDVVLLLQNGIAIFLENVVLELKPLQNWTDAESDALIFFYSLSVLRVLRIFYLAKSFDAMKILLLSTKSSLKVLVLLTICVLSLATMFGASVFLAEVLANEFTFVSIPNGMWYAIVTMTTVGYGDVVPVSTAGRLLGMVCALCGVIVMALPIAVIASRFTTYHDNLSARQQRRARLSFLKDHPAFQRKSEGGRPPPAMHDPGKTNTTATKVPPTESESSCFRLCRLKRRQRKVKSHPVWVSEYRSSSPPGAGKEGGGGPQAQRPGSEDDLAVKNFSSQAELIEQC